MPSAFSVNVIEICTAEMSPPAQVMILHETAHAWIDHARTDQRKAIFQELRGWTYWRDYDAAASHDNGTEQAAEIMVWASSIDRWQWFASTRTPAMNSMPDTAS